MLINACRMGIDVIIGKQSVLFDTPVYVEQYASVVGKKEGIQKRRSGIWNWM